MRFLKKVVVHGFGSPFQNVEAAMIKRVFVRHRSRRRTRQVAWRAHL